MQVTVNSAPNQIPVANAGVDKSITLPTNTVTLTGIGSDTDGFIASYAWVKISGPATGTIATPGAANTALNSLIQGVYQYELTVTDNGGATKKDTVQVTVNPAPNQTPVANAGVDQSITLPTNTTTLTGTGTDADGSISSYAWVKISGPAAGNIATPAAAKTILNNLAQGVYQYELTVTDNNGATKKDTVQVTVNPAPNKAPVANAGIDKTITLPANTITLTGIGSDADGFVVSYAWVKISGPSTGVIVTPGAANAAVNNLTQGVYQFELSVTDNSGATSKDTVQIVVNAAPNVAPVANAGTDNTITLPTNTIFLAGSGTDVDGAISTYSWTMISGPSAATIITANAASTEVDNLVQGVYQFELAVTDNSGATSKDTVQIVVNAAPNVAPVANAGTDNTITLPTNTIFLAGSGTDVDGAISTYSWTMISGPSAATIITANAASTEVDNLVQGVYQFELSVTDNSGATSKDTVQIVVNAAPNVAPVANAGTDNTITLPTNTIFLAGSGTDVDGAISAYSWTMISGPSAATIITANAASTEVDNLVQGVYQFELAVTDNSGATSKDTVQIVVNAAPNVAPVANAGTDNTITLPTNTIFLAGSGTDVDGAISAYNWTMISGPSAATIITANAASTEVDNLVQGVYQFELAVTDNSGATSKDTVQVTVNAANMPPSVNAGLDKTITLPTTTVTLTGVGADADGVVIGYSWLQISGPSASTIATPGAASTTVSKLAHGTYLYQLTVMDNTGATSKDTMQVTVNAAVTNLPPTANAGDDKIVILPTNTTILTGVGTDADGIVVSYAWAKISGPATGSIATPGAASTKLNNLVQGTYKYRLTVKDNKGAISRDTIVVTVATNVNKAPIANAGDDKTITLPVNTTVLSGAGTDTDGTISSYAWAQISGPSAATIVTASAATTELDNLTAGVYQFELTVTDNGGAKGKDTVLVTVNAPVQVPVANAGTDISINLPSNSAILTGTAKDDYGTISSYSWVKISGPTSGKIAVANASSTLINKLVQGTYQFELTVKDNNGAIGKDTIQVIVNKALKQAPLAKAGKDTTADKNEQAVKDTVKVTANTPAAARLTAITGITADTKNEFKVYPNPVRDIATVSITTNTKAKLVVSVINMNGVMVKSTELANMDTIKNYKLDMTGLTNGYYIVTVRFANGQQLSSKVMKYGGK